MVGPACCEKLSLKRGVWTAEEDAKILAFVSKHGSGNWTSVPKKAGLKRCGKSCRLRWTNYLRPDLKHDSFTPQEEDLIVRLHSAIGSRWSIIAQQLPGRTDNDVKNYWNTKLKKKLSEMGIDPVTHKPFSKLLADYGYIGGLQKPSTRIGSLSKDFKNAVLLKSEPFPTPPQGIRSIHSHPKQLSTSQKMEPTEDSFLCNRSRVQFQAIPKVSGASNFINMTEKETIPVAIFGEGLSFLSSTSSPSTSSTCSTAAQVPFSWNDFLLEDVLFSPAADNQEQESIAGFLSKDFVSHKDDVTMTENMKEVGSESQQVPISSDFQFSSSSDISFVEDMLDRENEMFLNFPHLMEEPSNY